MLYFEKLLNRKYILSGMLFGLLLLIGCKYTINIDLGLKSILSIVSQGNDANHEDTSVQIRFPMASQKKCEKEKENIEAILSKYYKEVKDSTCIKEGSKTMLLTNALLLVRTLNKPLVNTEKSMVGLAIEDWGPKMNVYLTMDKQMFESLGQDMKQKYKQTTKLSDLTLTIRLTNDIGQSVAMKIFHSYVDGKAYPAFGSFKLDPDKSFSIKVSDVMKDYVNENGLRKVLQIEKVNSNQTKPVKPTEEGNSKTDTEKADTDKADTDKVDTDKVDTDKTEKQKNKPEKPKVKEGKYSDDEDIIIY